MPLNYATTFGNVLRELYGQALLSDDLYNSNEDIQIINTKDLKLPTLSVSGYKDHTRAAQFNSGTYQNDYQTVSLDHDRDIEFAVDPMDVDETNQVVSIANIHKRFENRQAIPELDCYTFSKLYTEAVRVGAVVDHTALTEANILGKLDDDMATMADDGVPLERCILYITNGSYKLLKNAQGIQRELNVGGNGSRVDRRVYTLDDIGTIKKVPSGRFMTAYNFTEGYAVATTGKQINYILVDPEAQVSRVKYSYIQMFEPGSDSRTADRYLYQNRRFNGTFGIDELLAKGCRINAAS